MAKHKNILSLLIGYLLPFSATGTEWYGADMTDIGTYYSYGSRAETVSANGDVVIGTAWLGAEQADNTKVEVWAKSKNSITSIRPFYPYFPHAYKSAVSADGGTAVFTFSDKSNGESIPTAVIWFLGAPEQTPRYFPNMIATNISADGNKIVGAKQKNGRSEAYIYDLKKNKATFLGDLADDNYGGSTAYGISDDGKTVVGITSRGYKRSDQAFIWSEDIGEMKIIGNGTLASNGEGGSRANAVSGDGSTVVGDATSDFHGKSNAFIWHKGDKKLTGLGTLQDENKGESSATGVSRDGSVVVGYATDNAYIERAFIWRTGDSKVIDLGSLAGALGASRAYSVSADGTVVVGDSSTDSGERHATVWKIKLP
ncbi:hypothetical protein NZZ21_004509, partial [Escherichia albertii]|nr:hypothetical protein [Escherichia albertii]EJQ6148787.1 hypothetical protein [Escherichia albertii]